MTYHRYWTKLGHTSMLKIPVSFIKIRILKRVLNKEFSSLCEWFINNKWSVHSGNDKTKTVFFLSNEMPPILNILYGDYSLKQHHTVEYLGSNLDSNLNGQSMPRRVLKKINTKLNFYGSKVTIWIISREDCCVMLLYKLALTMDGHHGTLSWVRS